MDLPREYQVGFGIEPGAIFLIEKDGDKNEHYFVVLNLDPKTDTAIILVCASTVHQRYPDYIARVERRFGVGTVVHIQAGESAIISRDSTFDCNKIEHPTLEKLRTSVEYKRMRRMGKIEQPILDRLRAAALKSPTLEKKYVPCIKETGA
jgi:hypothetical protein